MFIHKVLTLPVFITKVVRLLNCYIVLSIISNEIKGMASSAYMFRFAFNKDYQHGSLLLTSPNFVVSRFSIDTIVNIKCFIGDNIKVVL